MKKCLLFFVWISWMLAGCSDNAPGKPSPMNTIRERGVLLVGVKVDTPHMSILNPATNEFEGMEADLARLLAKRIFGDERKIRIKPITTPKHRIDMLNEGFVDVAIGSFTIQEHRKKQVHFSDPYLTENLTFLVRKADHLTRIAQLDGKKIGIVDGSTPSMPLPEMLKERNLNTEIVVYSYYSTVKAALQRHQIDAFCNVRASALGYLDDDLEIMEETFYPCNYGIGIKLGNQELVDYVNEFLRELQANGTLSRLKAQWGLTRGTQ